MAPWLQCSPPRYLESGTYHIPLTGIGQACRMEEGGMDRHRYIFGRIQSLPAILTIRIDQFVGNTPKLIIEGEACSFSFEGEFLCRGDVPEGLRRCAWGAPTILKRWAGRPTGRGNQAAPLPRPRKNTWTGRRSYSLSCTHSTTLDAIDFADN